MNDPMGVTSIDPSQTEIPRADYESTPITRSEYVSAIVHLYRGELYRANSWRIRLDNTTNWAILTTAGVMTYTFGQSSHSHWVLLLGMALVSVFLIIEARRFRFYYVWRARVRMIEENFYGPILRRDPVSPEREWGRMVASDLFRPSFKLTRTAAMRARLTRNYWPILLVLLFAWCIKVVVHPTPATTWADVQHHLGGEFVLPWWLPLLYVGGFLAAVVFLFTASKNPVPSADQWDDDDPLREIDI